MDKIEEFVAGVKFLAPGIAVAIIFYMYSDVKFDQFGFLLFCAVAIILISFVTDTFLSVAAAFYSFVMCVYAQAMGQLPHGKSKRQLIRFNMAKALAQLNSARLASQFTLAVTIGVAFVGAYQNDLFYRLFGRFIDSPKISHQDTLHFVLKKIVKKEYNDFDGRPNQSRSCPTGASGCSRDVYLSIKTKDGDLYEGAMLYFPMKLEVQGFYLSPVCVARIQDKQRAALEKIPGPGVYVSIGDVAAIEYVDVQVSACFGKYHPTLARKSEGQPAKE